MSATTKAVTLEWFVGACELCAWEGNPTPDETHAREHADYHKTEVHATDEEE